MLQSTYPEQQRLRIIEASGRHLLTLIDEVLDIAKIEAGKAELQPHWFDLPALLQQLSAMIQVRADAKALYFQAETAADLPHLIYADEKRLRQVLLNLLDNAVKFTTTGGVTLRVESWPVEEKQKTEDRGREPRQAGVSRLANHPVTLSPCHLVHFTVIDSGCGIAAEKLSLIFEPFEQVRTGQAPSAGTGLGLTISRQLVALMGGVLTVQSQPGMGSRFAFALCLPTRVHVPAPVAVHQVMGVKGKAPTVLIVDDHLHNRALLRDFLAPLGFPVTEAATGQEALKLLYAVQPTILLVDLLLPDLNGYDLIQHLRTDPTGPPLVIIAISADVYAAAENGHAPAGWDAFLHKPIDFAELTATLQKHAGIEWVETLPSPSSAPMVQPTGEPTGQPASTLLPLEQLQTLLTAAQKGAIGALRQQVKGLLESEHPAAQQLGTTLQPLLQSYQMQKVIQELTFFIDNAQNHQ